MRFVSTTAAVVILCSAMAFQTGQAQTSKGILSGVVRDNSGAVVVNAKVTVKNLDTGDLRSISTGSTGSYRLDAITPGHYEIHVENSGFQQFDVKGITVSPSQVTSYDPVLKPGQVNETVQVQADTILLNAENGSLASTISNETMAKVPIFSLNPIELLTTQPGVQIVNDSSKMSNGTSVQVSGARERANNFMIDGQEINDTSIGGQALQPNIPDMYSDVVVYTHNAPAEFGRASGGVVNMISKSGTNNLHGDAWELYSGSGLDAIDGQTRRTASSRADKPRWNQHQYGFTVGGPILKDKLFFFGAAQWTRYYGNETAGIVTLPDSDGVALLRSLAAGGNATTAANATLLLSYLSNATYLNTFTDFGAASKSSLGDACPTAASCSITLNQYRRPSVAEKSPDTQWSYKVDYSPRAKDSFSFRYLHDRNSLTPDFFTNDTALPGFDTEQSGPSELGQGGWTHIFTPSLLNEFRFAETRLSFYFEPTAATKANPLYTAYNLSLGSMTQLGFNQSFPQGRGQDQYQWQDTVAWTYGRHTLRLGVDIGRRIETDITPLNVHGSLTFTANGTGSSALGNYLLNQLGRSGTAAVTYGNPRLDPHSWRSGVFAQDDIRLTSDLTLNIGVRYDYFTAPENSLKYPAIDANNPFAAINTVYKVAADKNNVAPRVGFAYSPHNGGFLGNGKTVVRGGFGIFFDSDFTNIAVNSAASAPNANAASITSTTGNGYTNATGLIAQVPNTLLPSSSVTSVVKNMVSPYSVQWNLGVERELPGQIGLNVMYVGNRGVKLFANQNYNYFDFNTGNRLNTTRGSIVARGNFADSAFHGLEIGAKHNLAHGIAVNGSYTYSKMLDDGSEVFTLDGDATSYPANLAVGGRKQDWGPSAFDHRHYAAFTYIWTPAGARSDNHGLDTFLSAVTRHWTISGTSRFQSGAYSTIAAQGFDTNGDGNAFNDRPILSNKKASIETAAVDGGNVEGNVGTYYDFAAWAADGSLNPVDPSKQHWIIPYGPQYLHQEIGRHSYATPGVLYNDLSVEKAVPTSWLHTDHGSLVFRIEAQNIANHNNVSGTTSGANAFDTDLMDIGGTFLDKSYAREPNGRSIRFWAKYNF